MLFDFSEVKSQLGHTRVGPLLDAVPDDFIARIKHGDFAGWKQAVESLPDIVPASIDLKNGLRIGEAGQCSDEQRKNLQSLLMGLHPWRKGPIELFGLHIDTEWRSDWKWDRLKEHIAPLDDRKVLDVGCGNGYHCWRMAGAGARLVIGVDSHLLFSMQYWALRHFLRQPPVHVLPLALEAVPENLQAFDSVFSMGVLYHNRSPFDHLAALKDCLRPGGELVLETLVIEGGEGMTLVPQGRYARMPNVWFLPSCKTLGGWLQKAGFSQVRLVDVTRTSTEEQRSTDWMHFESLPQALDPDNPLQTIEGYPAPVRAIFIAEK